MKSQMKKAIKIVTAALLACLLIVAAPIPGYAASGEEETQTFIQTELAEEAVSEQSDTVSYGEAPESAQPAEPADIEPASDEAGSPSAAEPEAAAGTQNAQDDLNGTDADSNDSVADAEDGDTGEAGTAGTETEEMQDEENEEEELLLGAMNAGDPKEINVVLSDLSIVATSSGGTINQGSTVTIDFKWDASSYGSDLHEGDYFVVDIPSALNLSSYARTPSSFSLSNELGTVFATAVVDRTNNKVTATFNSNVEDKYDVKGTMRFNATISSSNTTANEKNEFIFRSGSSVTTVSIDVNAAPVPGWFTDNTILHKNGGFVTWGTPWGPASSAGNINQVQYIIRINVPEGTTYHNVVLTDTLRGADGGDTTSELIPESFRLVPVEAFDGGGTAVNPGTSVNISDQVILSEDRKTFTLNLGDLSQKYYLSYYATFDYVQGNSVRNEATLTSDEITRTVRSTQSVAAGSGTADARVANRIRLIKVDEEDNSIRLADAEFEVTAPDGTTFTLTTGSDGTVLSGLLTQGEYTIRETEAPTGYDLNGETITVDLTEEGVVRTISNARTKIDVNVEKSWDDAEDQDGKRPESVTIHLYADGEDTGKTVILSEANQWAASFDDLDEYQNGTKISYTVVEDEVDEYTTGITGDAEEGYIVTNSYTPGKTSVSVVKRWDDADDQDGKRPESVTIHLYADGEDTGKTVTLTEANQWTAIFGDLDEYQNGTKISYTVVEDAVDEYTTEITGDAETGYIVTNSHTPTPQDPSKPGNSKTTKSNKSNRSNRSVGTGSVNTGDSGNAPLYIAMLLLALAAVGGVFYYKRKREV